MERMMKRLLIAIAVLFAGGASANAVSHTVTSPDGRLVVAVDNEGGRATYSVTYDGRAMLEPSALGLVANIGDFSKGLKVVGTAGGRVDTVYRMRGTKTSEVHCVANRMRIHCENARRQKMTITFHVSDNDVAFRYEFPEQGDPRCMSITAETTSFLFPAHATAFISPQSDPMTGWKRTKPSYEEVFSADAPLMRRSRYGRGYTFPCLFRVGDDGWVLVSETGTCGNYVGCHLSDYDPWNGGYTIAFPMDGEANGIGTAYAGLAMPGATPWRTITVGRTLKPIVETTVAYDVVDEMYPASGTYVPGRYTWSWLVWQDNSINYDDQVRFIDLAAVMGYEYCLVDGCWDVNIGRDRMAALSRYARDKGVSLLLWYNSNGFENDAPQTPRGRMSATLVRRREMAWLKSIGVKGIKVDFFGGDKQHTMQLYEDIMTDANDFGLQVIFHGCTLPRGWERMFPNFVGSEAVLASENVYFTDEAARREAFDLTLHPFCRNAVAAMDWGGTIMNRRMSRDNRSRHRRHTTDVFEMAAAVVNQSSLQCIAVQPNNLDELPPFELDFLRSVPARWDETRFVDGYPGRYVVLARRSGDRWFVAGLNATGSELNLTLSLPMLAGKAAVCYNDRAPRGGSMAEARMTELNVSGRGSVKVSMQPGGGLILVGK